MMKSIYVIVDASSYINLSAYEYRFGTLLSVLNRIVTLRYSSTVNQEISRHWNFDMPDPLERSNKIYYPRRFTEDGYEQRLFDQVSQTTRNKGEKDNFAVTIDIFLEERKRNLVFLTDDDNALALNGILNEVKRAFPIVNIWNSFDVVLFLYFVERKKFPFEVAKEAIRTLNRQMLPNDPAMDPIKMKERQKNLEQYRVCLHRIRKLHTGV